MDINAIMTELAQYKRLQEDTTAMVESLTDTLKQYMVDNQLDTITGTEHKATYKTVTSARIDTAALKQALPDIAAQYTKTTATKRFTFI